MDSCSASGVHSLPRGAVTTFPCKFGLQFFLSALGVHVHLVHPLATPMDQKPANTLRLYRFISVS